MTDVRRSSRPRGVALLALLVLALTGALSACGGSSDDEKSPGTTSGGAGTDASIVFVNPQQGVPWTTSMQCGARREAERLGVDLRIDGIAQYSVANFTQLLAGVAARNPDGVVFPIWDEVAYFNTISNLKSSGVEVVALDGTPKDASNLLSNVTSNNYQGGLMAAKPMLRAVGRGDDVLVIRNEPTNRVQEARAAGFIKELEAAGVNVLPIQYSEQNVTKATSIVTSTLAKYPDLAGIYLTNGVDGPAVLAALKQQGKKPGDVAVVTYDADPQNVEDVQNGDVLATVAQRPDLEGAAGVRYIVDKLNGKDVPSATETQVTLVTQDNVDDPEVQEAFYRATC